MITLYSYPELFGVADNNGYGLKVFAFMRLAGVTFRHAHIFDASAAPRGQLPYITDADETIGDHGFLGHIKKCSGSNRPDNQQPCEATVLTKSHLR